MTITIGEILDFLGQLLQLLIAAGLIYAGLRRWVKRVATSSEATAEQLATSNGTTVAGYVERSSHKLDKLADDMVEQQKLSAENREIALGAQTLANSAHQRLDNHLVTDHGFHVTPRNQEE